MLRSDTIKSMEQELRRYGIKEKRIKKSTGVEFISLWSYRDGLTTMLCTGKHVTVYDS